MLTTTHSCHSLLPHFMVYNEGLAVGLAIGIPCALIIPGCSYIWYRNQQKQNKEDSLENGVDMDLRDNQSFSQFEEQLHKPYNDPNKSFTTQSGDSSNSEKNTEKQTYISANNSTSTTNVTDITSSTAPITKPPHTPLRTPRTSSHQKAASAYDFYDTVIPMLPGEGQGDLAQPPHVGGGPSTPRSQNASSSSSIINVHNGASSNSKSLDNLAKQLTQPTFFEKLPSRAGTVRSPVISGPIPNNSSSELLKNQLLVRDAINDHYVYEASSSPLGKLDDEDSPASGPHPYRNLHHDPPKLKIISGNNIDANFDADIDADSPFVDNSQPDVIFK